MCMSEDAAHSDWVDQGDAPERTDAWFQKADFGLGGKILRHPNIDAPHAGAEIE
jgi:hypothetical protein